MAGSGKGKRKMIDDIVQKIQQETGYEEQNNILTLMEIASLEFRPVAIQDVYGELKNRVKDMGVIQKKIERALPKQDANALSTFLAHKLLLFKQPRIEELFDMQLTNIASLNAILININFESRRELSSLVKYSKLVSCKFAESLEARQKKKANISNRGALVQEAQNALKEVKRTDKRYFVVEEGIKDLRRGIGEDMHSYKLANDAAVDLGQEREFLVLMESLLRVSMYTCEKISSKAKRIENHIGRTKKIYTAMDDQQQAVALLHTAISTLSSYTLQVHQTLGKGIHDMAKTAHNPEILSSFYLSANKNLTDIIESVKKASDMDVSEKIVDKYLDP